MLYEIQAQGGEAKLGEFVARAKDKNSNVRLMGFGHRVYKNYDPRAKLMRETCYEVLNATGMGDDPLFKLAMALEKIALGGRVLRPAQAVPERRLLLGHRAEGHRHPGAAVHRHLRAGAHGRLDRAAERDDRGSGVQDRAAPTAVCRGRKTLRKGDRGTMMDTGRRGRPELLAV
jgi:hypothetical protein